MNPIDYLLEHTWVIWGTPILVREVVGNGFGLASAFLGMRRKIWAWPVGMIGNVYSSRCSSAASSTSRRSTTSGDRPPVRCSSSP